MFSADGQAADPTAGFHCKTVKSPVFGHFFIQTRAALTDPSAVPSLSQAGGGQEVRGGRGCKSLLLVAAKGPAPLRSQLSGLEKPTQVGPVPPKEEAGHNGSTDSVDFPFEQHHQHHK